LLNATDYPIAYLARAKKIAGKNQTIRDVCASCNNGPLSRLDGYVRGLYDAYCPTWSAISIQCGNGSPWISKRRWRKGSAPPGAVGSRAVTSRRGLRRSIEARAGLRLGAQPACLSTPGYDQPIWLLRSA